MGETKRDHDGGQQFRIVAHFMHETERDAALEMLPGLQATDAFLTGSASQVEIEAMRNANLIVETIAPIEPDGTTRRSGEPETPGRGSEVPRGSHGLERVARRPLTFSTRSISRRTGATDDIPDPSKPMTYLVQIDGPLLESYRAEFDRLRVHLEQSFRNGFYTARLDLDQVRSVRALPFVLGVSRYDAQESGAVSSALVEAQEVAAPAQSGFVRMLKIGRASCRERV